MLKLRNDTLMAHNSRNPIKNRGNALFTKRAISSVIAPLFITAVRIR